jgi:hypothetical protein
MVDLKGVNDGSLFKGWRFLAQSVPAETGRLASRSLHGVVWEG